MVNSNSIVDLNDNYNFSNQLPDVSDNFQPKSILSHNSMISTQFESEIFNG